MTLTRLADGFSSADVEGMSLDPQAQDPSGFQAPRELGLQPDSDGADPASPGGPAPYNGANPVGQPVTSNPMWQDPARPDAKQPYSPTPYLGPGPGVDTTTLHNARRAPMEETMTADLWTQASHDAEQEMEYEQMVRAKVATSAIWPFLSAARTEREFGHRLALCEDKIVELFPEDDFRSRLTASLHQDYLVMQGAAVEDLWEDFGKTAAAEPEEPGEAAQAGSPGNPAFFAAGPEAGPNTGSTGQFAQGAPDPVDPINGQYPMTPSVWAVPPNAGWVDRPMNFGKQAAKNVEWTHHEGDAYGFRPGTDDEIAHVSPYGDGGAYVHYRPQGLDTPESQVKGFHANDIEHGKALVEQMHPSRSKRGSAGYVDEGVQTGPGPNPAYFAGGSEGVAGDGQAGFPQDVSLPEPDERVDAYGSVPPRPPQPAPGTPSYSNSPHQASRWVVADRDNHGACAGCNTPVYREGDVWKHLGGDPGHGVRLHNDHPWLVAQQGNRVMASRRVADASDLGGEGGDTAPSQVDPMGAPPTPQSMQGGGAGSMAGPPLTIPNQSTSTNPFAGQGGSGPTASNPFMAVRREADVRERPTQENPGGVADEYDSNTWDAAAQQRPLQQAHDRNVNTPLRPREPIPVKSSDGQTHEQDDEDEERE